MIDRPGNRLPLIPLIRPVSGYPSGASRAPTDHRAAQQSPAVVRRLLADRPARLITGHYFANCQRTAALYPLCPLKFNSDNPALSESGKDAQKKLLKTGSGSESQGRREVPVALFQPGRSPATPTRSASKGVKSFPHLRSGLVFDSHNWPRPSKPGARCANRTQNRARKVRENTEKRDAKARK